MSEHKLIIGLDFGTTYRSDKVELNLHVLDLIVISGVAYCDNSSDSNETGVVRLIQDWPAINQGSTEKVPSRIAYGDPPNVEIKWGNQIRPNEKAKVHALMKLRLDERLKRSKQLKLLLRFLTSNFNDLTLDDLDSNDDDEEEEDGPPDYPGKAPVDIVADYLTEVRKWAWKHLEEQYGVELFATLTKELVVTVPAVWSERAKDLTLKAVTKAGWATSKIMLVTEPEAAAIFTLKWMTEGANREQVNIGDNFVL